MFNLSKILNIIKIENPKDFKKMSYYQIGNLNLVNPFKYYGFMLNRLYDNNKQIHLLKQKNRLFFYVHIGLIVIFILTISISLLNNLLS